MKRFHRKLKERIVEPSTWVSVAVISAVSIFGVPPEVAQGVGSAVTNIAHDPKSWVDALPVLIPAVMGILLPERKQE